MNERKEYSEDMKESMVMMRNDGKTYKEISDVFRKPLRSVQSVIRRHAVRGSVKNNSRSGRPRITTQRTDVLICRKVKKDCKKSALKYSAEIRENMGIGISPSTVGRRINAW